MKQPRFMSLVEAIANVVVGYGVAVVTQILIFPLFGLHTTLGLATGAIALRAECGSAFFADLVAHKEVRETYLKTAAAADLGSRIADEVSFGGITFQRYRGGAGFGVGTDKAVFYPEAVDGLFEIYYAPPAPSRRSTRWASGFTRG